MSFVVTPLPRRTEMTIKTTPKRAFTECHGWSEAFTGSFRADFRCNGRKPAPRGVRVPTTSQSPPEDFLFELYLAAIWFSMKSLHFQPYAGLADALGRADLSGRSVLITGGGHGIGFNVAKSFAEHGVGRILLVADLASEDDINRIFESLEFSPDILVNNAGYMPTPEPFLSANMSEYWSGFTINVLGTALLTQAYVRHRLEHGATPAVVITLNTAGAYGPSVPNLSAYLASKAALARWVETVSADIDHQVARFISVHPGAVDTDMLAKSQLGGAFPSTEGKLVGDSIVWTATEEAKFLAGRFVWANWDVQKLLSLRDDILSKNLFVTSLAE
ncbi:SDR family NAD(P)-dependent oxidoreductase [Aspergillus foveolatus]|uniref:SDR family NAD(P)-dependent oxidoreductase n=1 Tax=Aspergillus foveolatus TaxID=210207 RepID=UPI003CCDE2E1